MLKEKVDTVTEPMETILFTNLVEIEFNKNKPSEIIPILEYVCADYGLTPKYESHFQTAKRAIINCIKNN